MDSEEDEDHLEIQGYIVEPTDVSKVISQLKNMPKRSTLDIPVGTSTSSTPQSRSLTVRKVIVTPSKLKMNFNLRLNLNTSSESMKTSQIRKLFPLCC